METSGLSLNFDILYRGVLMLLYYKLVEFKVVSSNPFILKNSKATSTHGPLY